MSIVKSEFALALNQVATERGISPDDVLSSIEAAILAAYRREMMEDAEEELSETIRVKLNRDNGEARILEGEKDITPPGFGRIAAQTAKQVILQKIREAEKKTVISHYTSQVGSVTRGRVIRYDGYNAYADIGKVEALLPKEEQIKNEKYAINNNLLFYIKSIGEDKYGNARIILSRTEPVLIAELFKREVPEIANGTVEVKKVVREPGERAKIAVFSSQQGVDPVGACVGQKGVRVQTVTNEFSGMEKIDIIQWNRDDKQFIISALSPAKIQDIELDVAGKKARVTVDESQTPLAIGKGGINVNLASRLTGYEIDIVQVATEKKPEDQPQEGESATQEEESKAEEKTESEQKLETDTPTKEVSQDVQNEKDSSEEKTPQPEAAPQDATDTTQESSLENEAEQQPSQESTQSDDSTVGKPEESA